MNCWNVLEIEATNDRIVIKKAYASKLKVTKPDFDPEGFQTLHAAYKKALSLKDSIKRPKTLESNSDEVKKIIINSQFSEFQNNENIELESNVEDNKPESSLKNKLNNEYKNLKLDRASLESISVINEATVKNTEEKQNKLVGSNSIYLEESEVNSLYYLIHDENGKNERELLTDVVQLLSQINSNNLDEWRGLLSHFENYSIEQRIYFSQYFFKKLLEHFVDKKQKTIAYTTLRFIDSKLKWSSQIDALERSFGYEKLSLFRQQLQSPYEKFKTKYFCENVHQGNIVFASFGDRVVPLLIDVGLLFLLTFISSSVTKLILPDIESETIIWQAFFWWAILCPVLEASPIQATIGKLIFKLKVVSKKGKRLNIVHATLRAITFLLFAVSIKLSIWIQYFLSSDEGFLHDRFTFSRVIKR
jgi:uncharacterized RDD family membrane protein YckC